MGTKRSRRANLELKRFSGDAYAALDHCFEVLEQAGLLHKPVVEPGGASGNRLYVDLSDPAVANKAWGGDVLLPPGV